MIIRTAVPLALCAMALGLLGSLGSAQAQGSQAPFTIRRPPDGATVKEKVRIEIPRASIGQGSFVAFFVDDKFIVAQAPPAPSLSQARERFFTYIWDTKEQDADGNTTSDGEHSIRAVLYDPVADSNATEPKAESEVKVNVANKIKTDPGAIYLRYKYREGANLTYDRDSKSLVVSALSGLEATDDIELADASSKHLLGIEDVQPQVSLVRNKLTKLSLVQNGQQINVDPRQLSVSMYQELDPLGQVHYETGENTGLLEFTALGLPVDNALELPLLPYTRVSIGDTWRTSGQRIDVPGLPPALQPRVTLDNKFEGLEWEGGRPTAKIRQTYQGPLGSTIQFGPIEVTSPTVTYDRVIYIAYKSGTLVKTVRTLTVTGRTSDPLTSLQAATPAGGMAAGPFPGGRFPGRMGMGGAPPGMMMPGGPGMMGGGPPGMMGGGAGGYRGMRGMGGGGMRGFGGNRYGGGPGGMPGGPGMMQGGAAGMMGGGAGGYRGMRGGAPFPGGMPGMPGAPGFGGNRGQVVTQEETDHPVTLKSVTVTDLQSEVIPSSQHK